MLSTSRVTFTIENLKNEENIFWQDGCIKIDMDVSECDSEIINEADKKPVDCDK